MHLKDATEYRTQHHRDGLIPVSDDRGAEWCATVHGEPGQPFSRGALAPTGKREAVVRVERGMIIVDCPCGGAQLACRTDRRALCPDCLNADDHGKYAVTVWPDADTFAAIEAALLVRPPFNRNWYPNETVEDLLAENLVHGWVAS